MNESKIYTYTVSAWPTDRDACTALQGYLQLRTSGQSGVLGGAGLDFTGADLHDFDLSEAYLAVAKLDRVNLAGVDLNRATLSGTSLRNADLSGAYLHKVEADECDGFGVNFSGANLFRASFLKADLRQANLRDCQLSSTNLRQADLRDADLRGCQFGPSPTRLSEARLMGANVAQSVGEVYGPVHIDDRTVIDGTLLQEWFNANGASDVRVLG